MTLKEHIDDIRKSLENGDLPPNKAAVCDDIVRRIVHEVGWPKFKSRIVFPQYPIKGGTVDFALCYPPSNPCVFIEVKQVGGIENADAEEQLVKYAFRSGVPIAILTDGREWQFFHPTGEGTWAERKVCEFDLVTGDSGENAERLNRYINYDLIRTGEAIDAIKKDYEKVVQQRQVATQLPKVWNQLVKEKNEDLLLVIMDAAKNKVGLEPTEEQVLGFLRSLEREPKPNGNGKGVRNAGLLVTMHDGETINHKNSASTFVEVIEKLGIE